ncbi:MAG: hypothetical protein C5B51_27800, partial [Terriglobia bacterium]
MALCAALLFAQSPDEKANAQAAAKAKRIAQIFQLNARTLTLFDRQGKQLSAIGSRQMYGQPVLSPDGKRVAVLKADLDKENQDLWVLDVAGGKETRLTTGQPREFTIGPVWSPDGSQIAFVAVRGGNFGIYRIASSGGSEELLYKLPGIAVPSDWSADGRYLSFFASDLAGGVLYALPLNSAGERKPVELYRTKFQLQGGSLSPDRRYISYLTNESGKNEVYVRTFDPEAAPGATAPAPLKISESGGLGMTSWRRDGKEFYYLAADRSVMAVEVSTSPALKFGKPRVLFRPAEALAVNPGGAAISHDGERLVIAVPPPQLRQLTVFDRQGKVVKAVGEPGQYVQPHLSPDGSRVAVMRTDPETSNVDIWTYDVATGKGYAVTNDTPPENAPVWSPDGKTVFYVSTRESYAGIYRRAWDGTGEEELLFRYTPGAGMVLTDASRDGKFLTFYTGVIVLVPLSGSDPLARKPIDWLRDEYNNFGGRFSPDGRFVAYLSDEAGPESSDIYVRPFDASKPDAEATGKAQPVTKNGAAAGMINWREDGKELYYLTR